MVKYLYSALKNNKDLIDGEIEATTPRDAREKIRELGYLPLKVFEPRLVDNETAEEGSNNGGINFLSLSDKIMFVSELQVMVASGISGLEALQTIEKHSPKYKVKRISGEIKREILKGKTFSQAVNYLYHDAFGDIFIDLCETGENSGELDKTLERMLVMLKKQEDIKGDIQQALIYPCILIVIMFALLLFFSKVIFPMFMGVMHYYGGELMPFAASVVGLLNFIGSYWHLCILGIFAAIGAVIFLATNDCTRGIIDRILMRIPIVNEFVNYINLSNYMCILSISYDSGVPFMKTLKLAQRTIGNTQIKENAQVANDLIDKGFTLSDAMEQSCLLPGALVTMIASGEKAGNLSKMLGECVSVIDKKVDMALKALAKAFEPTMIVIMGAIVLAIAVAFFQVYIGMITSIGI